MTGTGTGSVFKNALVFGTAPVLQRLAALLLLPYFTHYLAPADYGAIELIAFWTGLFVVVFGMEYRSGFLWRMAAAVDLEGQRRIVTASVCLVAVLAILAVSTFAATGAPLLALQTGAPPARMLMLVLALALFVDLVGVLLMAVLQAQQRAARMVGLGLVQFVVDALLKIELVANRGMGVTGFFAASAVASASTALLSLWAVRDLLRVRMTVAAMRAECVVIVRYSAPLLWGAVAYLLVRKIDRPLLAETLSVAALGVYGRAARLTQLVLDFYVVPFQRSFDVWRLSVNARGEGLEPVARTYRWFMLGAGLVATGVATVGCDLFTGLADEQYAAVRLQVPLLNVAMLCQCGATVAASAFFVTQRTGAWTRIFVVGLAIEIAVALVVARPLGVPGVAFALACAHGFLWWAAAHFGKRLWPVPYDHRAAVLVIAAASLLSCARAWLPAGQFWLAMCIDTGLVLGYLVIASWCAHVRVADWMMVILRVRAHILRR